MSTAPDNELAALEQQNAQLLFLQEQAQLLDTDRTYRQARIQSIRSWRGFVAKVYTLFAVFFAVALAAMRPSGASTTHTVVRLLLALLALVFPWCIPGLAIAAESAADAVRDYSQSVTNQFRLATRT